MSVSDNAKLLHHKMREMGNSKIFAQAELQNLLGSTAKESELMLCLQELMNNKMIKLSKTGDEIRFQAISEEDASKVFNMSNDEAMIYEHIEASGREGIWTKTLKAKTNLHQHIVTKCLKSLENNRYIKSVKSVKFPTRKIYMLYNVQPSIDVTGGPWFTDSELDTEFIDTLVEVIWRFIASKTIPRSDSEHGSNPLQTSYIAQYQGVDLDEIMEKINSSRVSSVELGLNDIRSLCDVLVFDDKVEEIGSENSGVFKATWQSIIEKGLNKNIQDMNISNSTKEYLLQNQSYSIFDYKTVIEDLNDEKDLIYIDSWINE